MACISGWWQYIGFPCAKNIKVPHQALQEKQLSMPIENDYWGVIAPFSDGWAFFIRPHMGQTHHLVLELGHMLKGMGMMRTSSSTITRVQRHYKKWAKWPNCIRAATV
jgi:hypothetical protein